MRTHGPILAIIVLAFGAGCGVEPTAGKFNFKPMASTKVPFAHEKLSLECDGSDCDSRVGLLVVDGTLTTEPMFCTAALIDEQHIATASHCVAASPNCEGVSWGARMGDDLRWVACESVESTTASKNLFARDIAILRLAQSVPQRPFEMANRSSADGEIATMMTITPDRFDERIHRIRHRKCRMGDAADAHQAIGSDSHEIRWLESCPVRPGNSGAPLLNDRGDMFAIVHGGGPSVFAIALASELVGLHSAR
ncbi:MAG: trypsin-like peptidase domain-containing protein [Polyangiales bacterium]